MTATLDVDLQGSLSIVVQGGIVADNLVQTAVNCMHWRELFPAAQIVLAVSVTDLDVRRDSMGRVAGLAPSGSRANEGVLLTAVRAIDVACDSIVISEGALPLPPFKDDSGVNNINLQLAAAKTGLAEATGRYVLRIRSDAVFLDRRFVQQYLESATLSRGPSAVFQERVMISWLFTLNPFTVERLPLHFSDWFHFGRLADVRRLWVAEAMSLADAAYYRASPHAAGSNRREKQFYSRLAIEQHLAFACFRDVFPGLRLDYHNDSTSLDLSLAILIDNFAVSDLQGFVLDKYARDREDPEKQHHCLTRGDWLALARDRDEDPRAVLRPKLEAARRDGYL